jgi:hypothetical protein
MWNLLTNIKLLIFIGISSPVILIIISIITREWHWFQRSGAIIVIAGALLSSRKIIRKSKAELFKDETVMNMGHFVPTEKEKKEEKQIEKDIKAFKWGPWFLMFGTIIWAFGDLIIKMLVSVF